MKSFQNIDDEQNASRESIYPQGCTVVSRISPLAQIHRYLSSIMGYRRTYSLRNSLLGISFSMKCITRTGDSQAWCAHSQFCYRLLDVHA